MYFVDISKIDEVYKYIYVTVVRRGFLSSKKLLKFTFTANNPVTFLSDIVGELQARQVYLDDLEDGVTRDIGIGKITCNEFSDEDKELYNTDSAVVWADMFEDALEKQERLEEDNRKVKK